MTNDEGQSFLTRSIECPICDTVSAIESRVLTFSCPVCGWLLTPASEAERLAWTRQLWQKSQIQQVPTDREIPVGLERRLDAIDAELQRASVEREQLRSHLETLAPMLSQIADALGVQTPPWSEVGIDYQPLAELLASGQWQAADDFTRSLMLQAMQRSEEGYFAPDDLAEFPRTDLLTLDGLWWEYSHGRFGFSVQRWLWDEVGGNYEAFCDRAGWRQDGLWSYYDRLDFSLNAPEGHLPIVSWRQRSCYGLGGETAAELFSSLMARRTACEFNG
ncbi:MAG TPA: GUN4 domain-containing protein [Oscillatoriales cyanobacterium M59_W2019_021]|nr:GUN4 domain-containing protein [Oscillatoriales cyanobacterium M4454_W2019_049]HIK51017.1 GUN4 domain-containing protein [Oscillatoriales cyanobacterium M59_W2019_021]